MKKLFVLIIPIIIGCTSSPCVETEINTLEIEGSIKKVFNEALENWNKGSIEGYVAMYHDDTDTRLISGNNVINGKRSIQKMYEGGNPTRDDMGQSQINTLEVKVLSGESALVYADWQCICAEGTSGSSYYLFQLRNDTWKVTESLVSYHESPGLMNKQLSKN